MPLYDYRCAQCESVTTIAHPINDEPLLVCDKCGDKLLRQFNFGAVTFKGEGWGHQ